MNTGTAFLIFCGDSDIVRSQNHATVNDLKQNNKMLKLMNYSTKEENTSIQQRKLVANLATHQQDNNDEDGENDLCSLTDIVTSREL